MHILHLNTEKGWRGGERQTLLSMEGLRNAGVKVSLLCLRNHPLEKKAREASFPVVAVASEAGAFLHYLFRGRTYAVLHAQSSRAFGFAAFASLFIKTPLVYTRRTEFVPRGSLATWKYRRATKLIAISHAIKKVLHDAHMGEATVISSMVIPPVFSQARAEKFIDEHNLAGKKIIGVVAALTNEKDPLCMVRAAKLVCQKFSDAVFVHFGSGPLSGDITAEISSAGLGGRYLMPGFTDNVEDFFGMFDLFAMSSKKEGLGSSVLDAFAAGVPVAATDAGGLAELVTSRGLVSPKSDPAALAANVIRLLADQTLAHDFARKAREYVMHEHSQEAITRQNIALYRQIVKQVP